MVEFELVSLKEKIVNVNSEKIFDGTDAFHNFFYDRPLLILLETMKEKISPSCLWNVKTFERWERAC